MKNTRNFFNSLILSTTLITPGISNAVDTSKSDIAKILKNKMVASYKVEKTHEANFLHSNKIYVSKKEKHDENFQQYGEYKRDGGKYVLQDHKDGNKSLVFNAGTYYEITVKKEKLMRRMLDNRDKISNTEFLNFFNVIRTEDKEIKGAINDIEKHLNEDIRENIELLENDIGLIIDKGTQTIFVYRIYNGKFKIVKHDKISTGNPNRGEKYYGTPENLIIDRTKYNKKDRKSLGTNTKGYGEKGNPIFYLGKYFINKDGSKVSYDWDSGLHEIHLALHNTTPWAETQLGEKMSKGCIRVSDNMIVLLKKSNILDKGYVIITDYNDIQNTTFNDYLLNISIDIKNNPKISKTNL